MTARSTTRKPLRQAMPRVAEFIDAVREAFGREMVDQQIRNGIAGGTDFWASENGQTIGHLPPPPGATFHPDQMFLKPRKQDDHGQG